MPSNVLVTAELARCMTELSRAMRRQIGVIIDRGGRVVSVIVGDEREIVIPLLEDYPLGRRRLRGVRCVHTHLKNEPLSRDDLTDLALLRLDMMAAIGVGEDGLPADIYTAHLLAPGRRQGRPSEGEGTAGVVETAPAVPFHSFSLALDSFIEALEEEMARASALAVDDGRERAILVSVSTASRDEQLERLDELAELAATGGVVVIDRLCQRPRRIHPKYLMGSGKLKEVVIRALQKEATLLVFDQELTPVQVREIGKVTELKVIDRTQLILDIFARRAHSRDGKVQVELAQLRYRLPLLTGKGTALSRLMGGIGGRGPGETKLEIDRRRVQERITRLEKELESLGRGRRQRRRRRAESGIPIISIVGYTNAGKSTLLNALTASSTLVEDRLFATLDTATRRLRFPRERDAVITDTVGFIRDLPADLKRAFRSTLEEMEDADLLLHLVDISSPGFEGRMETVVGLLEEMGLDRIPTLLVFNKTDLVDPSYVRRMCRKYGAVALSAREPDTFGPLLRTMEAMLWPDETAERGADAGAVPA